MPIITPPTPAHPEQLNHVNWPQREVILYLPSHPLLPCLHYIQARRTNMVRGPLLAPHVSAFISRACDFLLSASLQKQSADSVVLNFVVRYTARALALSQRSVGIRRPTNWRDLLICPFSAAISRGMFCTRSFSWTRDHGTALAGFVNWSFVFSTYTVGLYRSWSVTGNVIGNGNLRLCRR